MVKQERALRTRAAVVTAASAEFARAGYDGTSLSRISRLAGMSVGALTFHFRTKQELADAVQAEGRSLTLAALDALPLEDRPALCRVVDLTLELARLMEEEPPVRAAVRLGRERPGPVSWSHAWLPIVHRLLDEAYAAGQLRESARSADVVTLVEHLTDSAEVYLRGRVADESEFGNAVARLQLIWKLVLTGVSADPVGPQHPQQPTATEAPSPDLRCTAPGPTA
ncbi:TetR/AcrR family transcriptional regulator [Streptomyces viridosporus]|uniref:TetR/AcrR family transcriptional regulator n=1 Tax=Streptomyces viridosporus TaxID=67581 RepID=UPI0009BF3E1D|nr:TetR/AcrR family transcriptional regulator [Streptomyces viridosporus]